MIRLWPYLKNKSHIIWDWNGTLLDDVHLCLEITRDLALNHGIQPLSLDRYLRIFRFPVIDYYREVGFDFDRTPFATLSEQFMTQYWQQVHKVRLFDDVKPLLSSLREAGIRSAILSATREVDLHRILKHHEVDEFFCHIFGIQDQYAASKLARGRDLMAALSADPSSTILIGDTDHDLEVGKALGIDVLLVDGGHQHVEKLQKSHHQPEHVISRRRPVSSLSNFENGPHQKSFAHSP